MLWAESSSVYVEYRDSVVGIDENLSAMIRTIWLYWHQGSDAAPALVQKCIRSWQVSNPGWTVSVLDRHSVEDMVSIAPYRDVLRKLDVTKQSNLLRLLLLLEQGGVWADATTFCMKPLDSWLPRYIGSGFFAFRDPGPDRLLANWFMYSEKRCVLVEKLLEEYVSFFRHNYFKRHGLLRGAISRAMAVLLNRGVSTTRFWLSPVVTRLFRIYPYFVFHYLFARIVRSNPECRKIWDNTPAFPAAPALLSRRGGVFCQLTNQFKDEVDEQRHPMYKLTWKLNPGNDVSSTLLSYLFDRLDQGT